MTVRNQGGMLNWRRIWQLAGALVVGAVVLMLLQRNTAPASELAITPPRTPSALDLRDRDTRAGLRALVDSHYRAQALGRHSLFRTCGEGSIDTFIAIGSFAFRRPEDEYVEIRRNQGDAGGTAFQLAGAMMPPPEPGSPARPPVQTRTRTKVVDESAMKDIESQALALWRDQLDPIIWQEGMLDGNSVVLEFCWRGQYGYFVRRNPDPDLPDDRRVLELANRLFELGGARTL